MIKNRYKVLIKYTKFNEFGDLKTVDQVTDGTVLQLIPKIDLDPPYRG